MMCGVWYYYIIVYCKLSKERSQFTWSCSPAVSVKFTIFTRTVWMPHYIHTGSCIFAHWGFMSQQHLRGGVLTCGGAGCNTGGMVSICEGFDQPIDPAQWKRLQFGLFSVPTSGPQLVQQRLSYALSCLWESAYKRTLAAYQKEQPMWRQQVSSKEIYQDIHKTFRAKCLGLQWATSSSERQWWRHHQ